MKVLEALKESQNKGMTEKEILVNLQEKCGLKLSEALSVCETEFGDKERFTEAAFDLKIDSLPSCGSPNEHGVTVVKGEWDD